VGGKRAVRSGRGITGHECIVQRVCVRQQPVAFGGIQRTRYGERALWGLNPATFRQLLERFREVALEVSQCGDWGRVLLTAKTRDQNWPVCAFDGSHFESLRCCGGSPGMGFGGKHVLCQLFNMKDLEALRSKDAFVKRGDVILGRKPGSHLDVDVGVATNERSTSGCFHHLPSQSRTCFKIEEGSGACDEGARACLSRHVRIHHQRTRQSGPGRATLIDHIHLTPHPLFDTSLIKRLKPSHSVKPLSYLNSTPKVKVEDCEAVT
jgi:hypothetical protein